MKKCLLTIDLNVFIFITIFMQGLLSEEVLFNDLLPFIRQVGLCIYARKLFDVEAVHKDITAGREFLQRFEMLFNKENNFIELLTFLFPKVFDDIGQLFSFTPTTPLRILLSKWIICYTNNPIPIRVCFYFYFYFFKIIFIRYFEFI